MFFPWLGFYGGLLGAVAGVLIADYWLVRRSELRLADLYRRGGACRYNGGWNWRALVALGVGALLAVGGAWSVPGQGPFPQGGLIPVLKPLYNYNWVVGFAVALVLYWGLTEALGGASPGVQAGDSRLPSLWRALPLDIRPDDAQRRPAARRGEVRRGPQVIPVGTDPVLLPQPAR